MPVLPVIIVFMGFFVHKKALLLMRGLFVLSPFYAGGYFIVRRIDVIIAF